MSIPLHSARRTRVRPPSRSVLAAIVAGMTLTGLACGGNDAPSAERFCGEVAANKDALTKPQLDYSDDIGPLLDLYRRVGALAPLGVADDWGQLVSAYETASTVVLGDQASEQQAVTAIYSSEKSAAAVDTWLRANCAVDIGPVVTIVSHAPFTVPPSVPADVTTETTAAP